MKLTADPREAREARKSREHREHREPREPREPRDLSVSAVPTDTPQYLLHRVRNYRQSSLELDQVDEAFNDFCKDFTDDLDWGVLARTRNKFGDNIVHLMAVSNVLAPPLKDLQTKMSVDVLKSLLVEKNGNGDTPLHLACWHLNLPLFSLIDECVDKDTFKGIAAEKNIDRGYNAFHMLCVGSYAPRVHNFIKLLQQRDVHSEERLNRYQVGYYNIHDNCFRFMGFFSKVFGKGIDALIMSADKSGNNGLMLCCYTCQDLLIESCLGLFTDIDKLYAAAISELPDSKNSPVKLICEFGKADCVGVMFKALNRVEGRMLSPNVCITQEAIVRCYQTTVGDNMLKDYHLVLNLIADAYGDKLEQGLVANSSGCPALIKSLYEDGIMLRRLIDKKTHVHFQNEILCILLFDMMLPIQGESNSGSQRFFSPKIRNPPENRKKLTKELLAKLLRIDWPDDILNVMARAVVEQMPDRQLVIENYLLALLNVIIGLGDNIISIPLALFYKVDDKLSQQEQSYVDTFQSNAAMMNTVRVFYCGLKSRPETQILAHNFLVRILESRSLLKRSVLQNLSLSDFDNKIRERFADVAGIKRRYVQALDENFTDPKFSVEVMAAQ